MPRSHSSLTQAKRVAAHRRKAKLQGLQRLEVAVPTADASLLRNVAATLRKGGKPAESLRRQLRQRTKPYRQAKTGAELVAFFMNSPLRGSGINLERDKSTTPPIDLG